MLEQLMDSADAAGAPLAGEGGSLQQLSKALLERALHAEMSEHLGYEKDWLPLRLNFTATARPAFIVLTVGGLSTGCKNPVKE